MAEETAVENGRISNFEELVTLTLTLTFDRVILGSSINANPKRYIFARKLVMAYIWLNRSTDADGRDPKNKVKISPVRGLTVDPS